MDRIVSNWTPRYVAAVGNTRNRWSESTTPASYGPSAGKSRSPSSNGRATRSWATACTGHWSTTDDTKVYDRWRRQASDVEMRSAPALSKIEDMNTFILFDKTSPSSRR